jgi:phospholipase/lecithinase/hemolysin
MGARHFLVANSVNVGGVPAARAAAEETDIPPIFAFAVGTHFTKKFNRQLAERLHRIASLPNVKIKEFDLFRSFRRIRAIAHFLGLNNADGCFDTDTYQDSPTADRNFHPDCAPDPSGGPPKFERFVFFDDLHPTGLIHAALGDALFDALHKVRRRHGHHKVRRKHGHR